MPSILALLCHWFVLLLGACAQSPIARPSLANACRHLEELASVAASSNGSSYLDTSFAAPYAGEGLDFTSPPKSIVWDAYN